jgi:magnesium chelatase family protein
MNRVCRAETVALTGLTGTRVTVEAAISQQLPGIAIIGLPDTSLAEAKMRVRVATTQAGAALSDRFITVNLSPASIPKHGSGFDLAIAVAALAASGKLPAESLHGTAYIGELGLDGSLRRPKGLLSAVIEAARLGFTRVMVPACAVTEAVLVPEVTVISAATLKQIVAWHRGDPNDCRAYTAADAQFLAAQQPAAHQPSPVDMAEVIGQAEAVEALTVAAAGRHNVSMIGPPGAGKTLLARRLPTILPDLSTAESLEASSIASLGGAQIDSLMTRPPFEAPHHTASQVAIIGGGVSNSVSVGAVTRACHGVLFLDEAPEFSPAVLDALRQPLESGSVEIHRSRMHVTLPANIQLVLAANPCPCGNAGAIETEQRCSCAPAKRQRYLSRISGPLRDRIDIRMQIPRVSHAVAMQAHTSPKTSRHIRQRVEAAREAARDRLRDTAWFTNSDVSGRWLRRQRLSPKATCVIDRALELGQITLRGYDRILRVAWSFADLAGCTSPGRDHIASALELRQGLTP